MKHLFKPAGTPPHSEARDRLAMLIETRTEITAKIEANRAAAARLASIQANESPIAAAIAALDAAETSAMMAFAATGEGEPPAADVARRAELGGQLAEARAQSEAARRGIDILRAENERQNAQIAPLNAAVDAEINNILVESAEPLIDGFKAARDALAVKQTQLIQLTKIIDDMADAVGFNDAGLPLFKLGGALKERLTLAFTKPAPDVEANSRTGLAWLALATALRSDATARLESEH